MRIAHIITRLILGGAQENTVLCCEDLIRRHGDDVLLITGPPLGPEGSLLDRARAGGVPVEIIPALRRPIHPWRDLISYRQIKQSLRRFRPDVVHTHSAKGGMLGRPAAWSLGVPAVIHTVHGAPFHPYQGRGARLFFQACERWASKRCHAIVSVADAMTDLMVSANVAPREKFTTVYSGMEVEPFLQSAEQRERVRRELGLSAGTRRDRQDRPAVQAQGTRRRDPGGAKRDRRGAERAFSVCRRRHLSRSAATADRRRRTERVFPVHRLGSAGADSGVDRRRWTLWSTPVCARDLPGCFRRR